MCRLGDRKMVITISKNREVELTAEQPGGVTLVAPCCLSFFLATTLAVASIALWVIGALEGRNFYRLELLLPIASFVFFMAGAHFMDRIDARKAKEYK